MQEKCEEGEEREEDRELEVREKWFRKMNAIIE